MALGLPAVFSRIPRFFDFIDKHINDPSEIFVKSIYSYIPAQALEDGLLVDVSETALKAGFLLPMAITAAVSQTIENIPARYPFEDAEGRL